MENENDTDRCVSAVEFENDFRITVKGKTITLWSREWHIIRIIMQELRRAEEKHPSFPIDPVHASAIIAEECGELTQAALQYYYDDKPGARMVDEAVQVGAMAIRFVLNSSLYVRMF
jgi:hypothetical protein